MLVEQGTRLHKLAKLSNKSSSPYLTLKVTRLASLVGITERETGVGKLGWHGNSTGFDRKNNSFFSYFA